VCDSSSRENEQVSMKTGAASRRSWIAAPHLFERRFDGRYINAFAGPFGRVRGTNALAVALPLPEKQITHK
jgi:hypothetical protein